MSPGYDLCPSVSSVVPVFALARTNASIEAAELSGMTARRMRPERVSRYFAPFRLGLAWLAPGSIIDRRSFCASNQAVLYVIPSWASNWSADMPLEWVAMRCAAQNQTVRGNLERCITVPAVIEV